jgi:NodT family efflux transporter outer membrane factor (OMF) lipoprotein
VEIRGFVTAVPVCLAALLAGCSFVPEYQRPDPGVPARFNQATTELPRPGKEWWRDFASPELNALVERGLANNHDLKAALHRVGQAEAQASAGRSSLFPLISGFVQHDQFGPSGGVGTAARYGTDWQGSRLTQAGVRLSYEIDLWGKNRAAAQAAEELVRASEFDRKTVALTLVGDIVTTYFQAILAAEQARLAADNLATLRRQLDAVQQRAKAGEATQIEVAQQRTAVAQAEAQVPAYRQSHDLALHRLAVLLGEAPGSLRIAATDLRKVAVPPVAAGLPSALLESRPDIAKAEAELLSANANIGVARAKFLPSFALTGEGGVASPVLASLLSPVGLYYSVLGSATQTIFDAGRTAAEVDYNKARFRELGESYQTTVLTALREVEDGLVSSRWLADQEKAQKDLATAARQANDMSNVSYQAGQLDYLTLLETERARYAALNGELQMRFSRLVTATNLAKALGGMELPPARSDPDAKGPG